jgi:hypothetical protein
MKKAPDYVGESRDSSPLELEKLSDEELSIILQIEHRLYEAQPSALERQNTLQKLSNSKKQYLVPIQVRHPRVLLLDGGRGTGKTSMLLTLAHRWTSEPLNGVPRHDADIDAYETRIRRVREKFQIERGKYDFQIPDHVYVVGRILDFDPLPPEMPFIAGIMQTWKSLAESFDDLSNRNYDCDEEGDTLMDRWHRLFRIAAVGWAAIPQNRGLIEQVLDRQEQVEDWQHLDSRWRDFVDEVIKRGKCLPGLDVRMSSELEPIFVIMIDDCDLQVGRIRELLPALRMLYHPNVFFLVAAHGDHMVDMMKLSFYGQQNDLARHRNASSAHANDLVETDKWAEILARSSVEKVFSKGNQWKLEWLSILDFLAFPGQDADLIDDPDLIAAERSHARESSFFTYLHKLQCSSPAAHGNVAASDFSGVESAGKLILDFALESREFHLPGVMTYRGAEQLRQYVMHFQDYGHRATELLTRLLSGNRKVGEQQATVRRDLLSEGEFSFTAEVQFAGQLAALYRPGPREFGGTYDVVLSDRPDFVFVGSTGSSLAVMSEIPEGGFNFTAALVAQELYEKKFPFRISGLQWDTYLSHSWTEWSFSPRLSFAWTRYQHPSPSDLFKQTREWAKFIKSQVVNPQGEQRNSHKLERYAYAWIYYQLKWSNLLTNVEVPSPLDLVYTEPPPWDKVLDFSEYSNNAQKRWVNEILPLLARPELGFPPSVNEIFLKAWKAAGGFGKDELKRLRRRLVTDAYVAAAYQRGDIDAVSVLPGDDDIDTIIRKIDATYEEVHRDDLRAIAPELQWIWIETSDPDTR